jgi:hypothetical protein
MRYPVMFIESKILLWDRPGVFLFVSSCPIPPDWAGVEAMRSKNRVTVQDV